MYIKHDDEYYRRRKPRPDFGPIDNFKRFLWDPERRAFLDRTAQEWLDVGIFYLCFYVVLFSFTGFLLWITYKNVACHGKPYFDYDRESVKAWLEPSRRNMPAVLNLHGPGVVFKPNIFTNGRSPRILVDESTEMGQPQKYIREIERLLVGYKVNESKFDESCNDRSVRDENAEKPCFFDVATLGQCSRAPFGYTADSPQPCVYIQFNKRFGWLPIHYSEASVLPVDMPEWLQKIIHRSHRFHVWLSCEGKSQEDREKLGEIEYLPKPGFPVEFFPFSGQINYLAPMIALRFNNLPVDQQVTVECKTWARNIDNENRYNLNFKIMIKKS